jgi:hypothetical protein
LFDDAEDACFGRLCSLARGYTLHPSSGAWKWIWVTAMKIVM